MTGFQRIGMAADVPLLEGKTVTIGGRRVAVFRTADGFHAIGASCPHKGGPLADGMLIGEQVVCPLHAFRFDGTSGECDQAHVCAIEAFPAEVRDGTVFVTVPLS